MIDVKAAIKTARQHVIDLYSQAGITLADVLLEEVRRDGPNWLITIGFRDPTVEVPGHDGRYFDPSGNPAETPTEQGYIRWPRLYKVVRVDQSGTAVEMVNRAA